MATLVLCSFASKGQNLAATNNSPGEWKSDVEFLIAEMERIHPNLYYGIDKTTFNANVDNLKKNIGSYSHSKIIVELLRLMASLSYTEGRDGHSRFIPVQEETGFSVLPIRLFWFDDGCFIVSSQKDNSLVGKQVISIEGIPINEIYDKLEVLIPRDNEMTVMAWMPLFMIVPEILNEMGIISNTREVLLQLRDSETDETISKSISASKWSEFKDWSKGRKETEALTWRFVRHSKTPFSYEMNDGIIYFEYNAVRSKNKEGKSLKSIVKEISSLIENENVKGLVIDVRDNQGGNNDTYPPFIKMIKKSSINKKNRLFLVCGRNTFSAAGNFVTEMTNETNATLVGEPMGGGLNQYGDSKPIVLPNSGLELRISSKYHQKSGENDPRLTIPVEMEIPIFSYDYFSGKDLVMETVREKINQN